MPNISFESVRGRISRQLEIMDLLHNVAPHVELLTFDHTARREAFHGKMQAVVVGHAKPRNEVGRRQRLAGASRALSQI